MRYDSSFPWPKTSTEPVFGNSRRIDTSGRIAICLGVLLLGGCSVGIARSTPPPTTQPTTGFGVTYTADDIALLRHLEEIRLIKLPDGFIAAANSWDLAALSSTLASVHYGPQWMDEGATVLYCRRVLRHVRFHALDGLTVDFEKIQNQKIDNRPHFKLNDQPYTLQTDPHHWDPEQSELEAILADSIVSCAYQSGGEIGSEAWMAWLTRELGSWQKADDTPIFFRNSWSENRIAYQQELEALRVRSDITQWTSGLTIKGIARSRATTRTVESADGPSSAWAFKHFVDSGYIRFPSDATDLMGERTRRNLAESLARFRYGVKWRNQITDVYAARLVLRHLSADALDELMQDWYADLKKEKGTMLLSLGPKIRTDANTTEAMLADLVVESAYAPPVLRAWTIDSVKWTDWLASHVEALRSKRNATIFRQTIQNRGNQDQSDADLVRDIEQLKTRD